MQVHNLIGIVHPERVWFTCQISIEYARHMGGHARLFFCSFFADVQNLGNITSRVELQRRLGGLGVKQACKARRSVRGVAGGRLYRFVEVYNSYNWSLSESLVGRKLGETLCGEGLTA